jgi:hypothetical protein
MTRGRDVPQEAEDIIVKVLCSGPSHPFVPLRGDRLALSSWHERGIESAGASMACDCRATCLVTSSATDLRTPRSRGAGAYLVL